MKPEKQLYQWDVNQYLTELQPTAQFVDYPIGNEVIRIETDGTRCRIPDEVLQTYGGKTCYERYPDGTFRAYSFTVLYAPKPPDYIYTPEEHTTFEALTARVDAAIDEIKRRADSGEFTPKKGVDYFTDAEKVEMMESVSSGAVGEFREVVNSATADFNKNSSVKTNDYNTNATEKLSTYNSNAEQKLEAYNQNHTEKVTEYNQNAETKTAEFDSNAAALQTEVDRLRGECDNLAAENRKQENRIDALIKLNKGQTYDIIPEEGETASRTAPSGSKYVSVDKVGGKSVVWNQLWNYGKTRKEAGVTFTYENHFYDVVKNTTANNGIYVLYNVKENNKYYLSFEASSSDNIVLNLSLGQWLSVKLTEKNERYSTVITSDAIFQTPRVAIYLYSPSGVNCSYRVGNIKVIDLTQMFGAGNEPTAEQFEQMFPTNYYPYSEPTIISSQTDRVDTVGFNQWDEEWEVGNISASTGNNEASDSVIRAKNYIPILPNTTYYAKVEGWGSESNVRTRFYDINKNYIGYTTSQGSSVIKNQTFVTPPNAYYMRFAFPSTYGTTYNHDICINLSDPSRNGEYEPYSLQQITTSFPVLNSAGSVYDYIDLNEGKHHQRVGVVDLGSFAWILDGSAYTFGKSPWLPAKNNFGAIIADYVFVKNDTDTTKMDKIFKTVEYTKSGGAIYIKDSSYTDATAFKEAMNGVMLYYELAEEVITDIDIPTELTEWLPVEAGGTVTFHNSDESKQLAVPNEVSWVRKLDEVN